MLGDAPDHQQFNMTSDLSMTHQNRSLGTQEAGPRLVEARSAREEADFYYSKLVRIEARRAHAAPL